MVHRIPIFYFGFPILDFEIANWRMILGGAWHCHACTAGNWWVGRFYIIRQFRNAWIFEWLGAGLTQF